LHTLLNAPSLKSLLFALRMNVFSVLKRQRSTLTLNHKGIGFAQFDRFTICQGPFQSIQVAFWRRRFWKGCWYLLAMLVKDIDAENLFMSKHMHTSSPMFSLELTIETNANVSNEKSEVVLIDFTHLANNC